MRWHLTILFFCSIMGLSMFTHGHPKEFQQALQANNKPFFIENKGQWPCEVLFLCRMGGLDAWITKTGVHYNFYELRVDEPAGKNAVTGAKGNLHEPESSTYSSHGVVMDFEGCQANPVSNGKEKQEAYYNYFLGRDPAKHATRVGLFLEAEVKEVYPGIDIRYYIDQGHLRFDFIVSPGADPAQIAFTLRGQYADALMGGALNYTTRFGEVSLRDLYTYQGNEPVASRFVRSGEVWKIALAAYDRDKKLVIDPLIYSTYLGGSNNESISRVAIDGNGNAFVVGSTNSSNYPATAGVYQTSFGGGANDVVISKFNPNGTGLLYSAFLGGSGDDKGSGIAIDGIGDAYVIGGTSSSNYPVTAGAIQSGYGGGDGDVFVSKINSTGTGLVYSTYLGGSGSEGGSGIAVDGNGNAYVVGTTFSTFPVTAGALQTNYGGGIFDAFVGKLNAAGTGLVYSTYLGGNGAEYGRDIAIDGSGNAYVTGYTNSTNYATSASAFQSSIAGGDDAFVAKLNANGSGFVYSTYLGGNVNDYGRGIAVDINGNAYVTGGTTSSNYPHTVGAFQTTMAGGDAFVTKLNATGTGLVYSTYIGGSGNENGQGIALDGGGNAYVVGWTLSNDFPVTAGSLQTIPGGGNWDAFVIKLNSTGAGLVFSTYIGGGAIDMGYDIKTDLTGNAFVTGQTNSVNFPCTVGAFQTTPGMNNDAFLTKLNPTGVTGVSAYELGSSGITIYPNPTSDKIELESQTPINQIQLTDLSGRVLMSRSEDGSVFRTTLSLAHLPKGLYILRVNGQYAVKCAKE